MVDTKRFFVALVIAIVGAGFTVGNVACTALGLKQVDVHFVGTGDGGPNDAGADDASSQ